MMEPRALEDPMTRRAFAILIALLLASLTPGCDGGDGGVGKACEINADCDADLYCEKVVGECEGVGTCQDRPRDCAAVFDPACGCDGVTYSNGCVAAGAGVSLRSQGPCP
jgi:hypothetical protein